MTATRQNRADFSKVPRKKTQNPKGPVIAQLYFQCWALSPTIGIYFYHNCLPFSSLALFPLLCCTSSLFLHLFWAPFFFFLPASGNNIALRCAAPFRTSIFQVRRQIDLEVLMPPRDEQVLPAATLKIARRQYFCIVKSAKQKLMLKRHSLFFFFFFDLTNLSGLWNDVFFLITGEAIPFKNRTLN